MIFGLALDAQEELITRHCFGDCGMITVGAVQCLGRYFMPCRKPECAFRDEDSPVIGEVNGEEFCMRRLKEEGK